MVKIIDKTSDFVDFNKLNCGSIFRYDGEYFMKTSYVQTYSTDYNYINAVDMLNGHYRFFQDDIPVKLVSCDLVVR